MNLVIIFKDGQRISLGWSNEFDKSKLRRFVFEYYGKEIQKIIEVKNEIIL